MKRTKVVSIGHSHTFYVVFVPLEYVPTIPPHSSCVINICFILFKKKEGTEQQKKEISAPSFKIFFADGQLLIYVADAASSSIRYLWTQTTIGFRE